MHGGCTTARAAGLRGGLRLATATAIAGLALAAGLLGASGAVGTAAAAAAAGSAPGSSSSGSGSGSRSQHAATTTFGAAGGTGKLITVCGGEACTAPYPPTPGTT